MTKRQERIYKWISKTLNRPKHAEIFKILAHLVKKRTPEAALLACHAGRDLMNRLANDVAGLESKRFDYKNQINELSGMWQKEGGNFSADPVPENGRNVSPEVCNKIDELIKKNEEATYRSESKGYLFFIEFFDYQNRHIVPQDVYKRWKSTKDFFESRAHIGGDTSSKEFKEELVKNFKELEELFHIAASSQYERMRKLKVILKNPTLSKLEDALSLTVRANESWYFFPRLKNAKWLLPLKKAGIFSNPPRAYENEKGQLESPSWPQMRYLKNIAKSASKEVLSLLIELPKTNNIMVYHDIIDIAAELAPKLSVKLYEKINESFELNHINPRRI